MSVVEYLNAVSDGRSLQAALGPSAPSFALLQRASVDPIFAVKSDLSSFLRLSIPVSVLVANPFQVCKEGPHEVVRPLGLAFIALFSLGFPTLGLWSLWAVGRLKGLRRRLKRRFFARSSTTDEDVAVVKRPVPRAAAIVSAIVDPTLRKRRAWTIFFDYYTLTVISGCLSVQGGTPTPFFLAMQAIVVLTSLVLMVVLAFGWSLYIPEHAWKLPAKLALCFIVILAAVFNCILAAFRNTLHDSEKVFLSILPPALAIAINGLIIYFWWRSTLISLKPEEAREVDVIEPRTVFENPLFSLMVVEESPSTLWKRHTDEEDEVVFWFNPALNASEWELPEGSSTECGWTWVSEGEGVEGGGWLHTSGVFTSQSPPANLEEAETLISSKLRELEEPPPSKENPTPTPTPPSTPLPLNPNPIPPPQISTPPQAIPTSPPSQSLSLLKEFNNERLQHQQNLRFLFSMKDSRESKRRRREHSNENTGPDPFSASTYSYNAFAPKLSREQAAVTLQSWWKTVSAANAVKFSIRLRALLQKQQKAHK